MVGAHFFDTVFTFNEKWLEAWAKEYKARGLHKKLPFTVFARPDRHNLSDKKIKILADAGCAQVRMGIEAGDSDSRYKLLSKAGCSNDIIYERINKLAEHNILAKTYSIIGFPHDTKKTIWNTLKFANNPQTQTRFVLSYTPIPGTPMAKKVVKMHREKNIQKYSFHFSGGVDNANYGPHYINLVLVWCYLFFGSKQAWLSFRSNPVKFVRILTSRWYYGFKWGNPLLLTTLYGLIHASFWPDWRRLVKQKSSSSLSPVIQSPEAKVDYRTELNPQLAPQYSNKMTEAQ